MIETNDSQREQCLENTAGGVGFHISMFPNMFLPSLRHEVIAKSLYCVPHSIAAVYLSMLGLNVLIAFDIDRM